VRAGIEARKFTRNEVVDLVVIFSEIYPTVCQSLEGTGQVDDVIRGMKRDRAQVAWSHR
jgi:hypothetical protein